MLDSGEKHKAGGLTTSTHSALQGDNTFMGWTPSSSTQTQIRNKTYTANTVSNTLTSLKHKNNKSLVALTLIQSIATNWMLSYTIFQHEVMSRYIDTCKGGGSPSFKSPQEEASQSQSIFILVTMGRYINRLHSPFPPGYQLNISTLR